MDYDLFKSISDTPRDLLERAYLSQLAWLIAIIRMNGNELKIPQTALVDSPAREFTLWFTNNPDDTVTLAVVENKDG
jgi:hypothetical protein